MELCNYSAILRDLELEVQQPFRLCASSCTTLLYAGFLLAPSGVSMISKLAISSDEIHELCKAYNNPYIVISGSKQDIVAFEKYALKVTDGLSGESDIQAFLAALNTSKFRECFHVSEHNVKVEALFAPAARKYPSNLPEHGRPIWDTVMVSPTYAKNTQGQSTEAKWAIAVKMYADRCARLGVQPFAGVDYYTKEKLTEEYAKIYRQTSDLELQLRNNFLRLIYINGFGAKLGWHYVETTYNNSNFVVVFERPWTLEVPGAKLLGRLVRSEGFKKNQHGAGYILTINRNSMLRIRIKKGASQAQMQMFIMFTKDKITQAFKLDSKMSIPAVLRWFTPIAKQWAKTRKF